VLSIGLCIHGRIFFLVVLVCADPFGSPSLDEVGDFSRALGEQIEISMGEEAAGEIEIEVSSPVSVRPMFTFHKKAAERGAAAASP